MKEQFQKGIKKGIEEGKKEGREEGMEKKERQIVLNMHKKGFDIQVPGTEAPMQRCQGWQGAANQACYQPFGRENPLHYLVANRGL